MYSKSDHAPVSQREAAERKSLGKAEAEQVLTEIGVILVIMLGIAVATHSLLLLTD